MFGIGKDTPLAGRHPAVTRSERTPASTILLISASPMFDGTHSLSRLALAIYFFGFPALFFGDISQIQLGFGGGCKCECEIGNGRTMEEDEMAK